MASNVVAHLDAKDNIYPMKERPENKIDGIVALIMAISRAIKPVIDFVDTGHPGLLRMWDKRQRGYRVMGYRVEAQRELGESSEI